MQQRRTYWYTVKRARALYESEKTKSNFCDVIMHDVIIDDIAIYDVIMHDVIMHDVIMHGGFSNWFFYISPREISQKRRLVP